MRPPETQEHEAIFNEAWQRTLGFFSPVQVVNINGVRYAGHGVRVVELMSDGEFTGEIEVPHSLLKEDQHFTTYVGFMWVDSKTFLAFPWHPLRAWILGAIKDRRFGREFARSPTKRCIMVPYKVARAVTDAQLSIGMDENGEIFKSGLSALEQRRK